MSGLNSDSLIGIAGVVFILLGLGGIFGLVFRKTFSWKWLLIAACLVVLNDFFLTRGYGLIPKLLEHVNWNWQGKIMALIASLSLAALPAFGWGASGITLTQKRGHLISVVVVALVYCGFFVALALAFPTDPAAPETVAFQMSLPGIEEEIFYRGILLLALSKAFTGRVKILGVNWGWGDVLSCVLFGMAHALGYAQGHFSFDSVTMALTAIPSLLAVWIRLRTGSLLIPVLLHNFGNSIPLFI